MTKDEIYKLAEKAGFGICLWEGIAHEIGLIWCSDEYPIDEELLRFAALVAAAEREACAATAEQVGQHKNHIGIAAAIRARGSDAS